MLFPEANGDCSRTCSDLPAVLEDADVDTVGGLLAQQLGRVPLPGAEAEVHGLLLLAEGGKDARGRIRINTVLVEPVEAGGDVLRSELGNDAGRQNAPVRREESDVRPA